MAERRYTLNKITGSDAFAELSFEAQALYMHLTMAADDDGIVASPKKVQKGIGASSEALECLEGAGYICIGDGGACNILHWEQINVSDDATERARANNRERVRRYRARRKAEEIAETAYAEPIVIDSEEDEDVTPCNADVTPCNVTVTLHTVTKSSPLSSSPFSPFLSSPHTPLYTNPYNPHHLNPLQNSSSSVFSARAQEFSLEYWGRKLKKYEKAELRALSLDLAQEREGTEAGELCLSEDDIKLLCIAFSISADAGVCNLTYLRGIFENWHEKGIYTASEYFNSEIKRGTTYGNISRRLINARKHLINARKKGTAVC